MHRQAKKEIPRYMMHICKETTAISYFELRWRYDYCNIMGTSSCLEKCMQEISKGFIKLEKPLISKSNNLQVKSIYAYDYMYIYLNKIIFSPFLCIDYVDKIRPGLIYVHILPGFI